MLKPIHFPKPVKLMGYHHAPIYKGPIKDEVPVGDTPSCFPGAWYRKVVSSQDSWLGIEATVTLPDFELDQNRYDQTKEKFLDNPSVYFGGYAGAESDAGLTWTLVGETAECLKPSKESLAFRPFWRYIHGEQNTWENSDYRHPEHYYLPGDKLRISVFSPKPDYLQMQIEVLEKTTIPKYVERRKSWRIENDAPTHFITPPFPSIGHGGKHAEFKRVNAIDQSGNEGKAAQPTNSQVFECIWHEVYLYREIKGEVVKVPFSRERQIQMACPSLDAFTIKEDHVDDSLGGEIVAIHPGRTNN